MEGQDMNAFLEDNQTELALRHWTSPSQMLFSHTHPQFELYFCVDNVKQKSIINGAEYLYEYPCVIISSPYTVHSMSCDDPCAQSYERFVLYFSEKIVEQIKEDLLPKGLLSKNSGYMLKLCQSDAEYLKRLILTIDPKDQLELKLLLVTFLNKLIRMSPMENAICVGKSSFYIQDVLQYMAEHFAEQIDVDSVAHKFLISRSKLDRDFKQFTGITVHGFLDMCRLNQAKILLNYRPDMSVSEISSACGFSGETYFFPFFKKNVGMTPLEYKKYLENRK